MRVVIVSQKQPFLGTRVLSSLVFPGIPWSSLVFSGLTDRGSILVAQGLILANQLGSVVRIRMVAQQGPFLNLRFDIPIRSHCCFRLGEAVRADCVAKGMGRAPCNDELELTAKAQATTSTSTPTTTTTAKAAPPQQPDTAAMSKATSPPKGPPLQHRRTRAKAKSAESKAPHPPNPVAKARRPPQVKSTAQNAAKINIAYIKAQGQPLLCLWKKHQLRETSWHRDLLQAPQKHLERPSVQHLPRRPRPLP